jgi:hypothetical protein
MSPKIPIAGGVEPILGGNCPDRRQNRQIGEFSTGRISQAPEHSAYFFFKKNAGKSGRRVKIKVQYRKYRQ